MSRSKDAVDLFIVGIFIGTTLMAREYGLLTSDGALFTIISAYIFHELLVLWNE